jgi:[NiFe] hydrogenase diaphorase moiety large subunit
MAGTDPEPPTDGPAAAAVVDAVVKRFGRDRFRLMDIVQAVQQRLGWLSDPTLSAIAASLGVPAVDVADMASFYAFLNRERKGRFHIRLSKSPVSLMQGAADVARAFAEAAGAAIGETSPDGDFTVEWTSDIGMADQEPSALINGAAFAALSPPAARAIVAALRRSAAANALPLFPGGDAQAAAAALAPLRSSLAQAGPILLQRGDGGEGLRAALRLAPAEIIAELTRSRLRGRGGAGFPTGLKWKLCRQSIGGGHPVVCNADEGEPGTFKDRVLLAETPDLVFDGMTIAGYALGARHGLLYLRGEYAHLWKSLHARLQDRRRLGLLGDKACGRAGFDFDIRIQLGAGAYICGEESALIESLEGKRGAPRDRPPFPTRRGYLRQPTVIDNVETFACVVRIMEHGAEEFARRGTRESTGTKLLSVSGDCPRPGVYEVDFGMTVNDLLDLVAAPEAAFVQVGGPSGQCVAPKDYGRRIAFEDLATAGAIMVFGPGRDVLEVARQFTEFFVDESCGWCTPCRVGTTLLRMNLEKILAGRGALADVAALEALGNTVARTSRCGLGQTAANPILSTLRNFPQAYEARLRPDPFLPRATLEEALAEAIEIRGRAPAAEEGA